MMVAQSGPLEMYLWMYLMLPRRLAQNSTFTWHPRSMERLSWYDLPSPSPPTPGHLQWMFSFCPPPAIVSTTTTSSSSSRTSTPAASSVPQPMDLDCTHPMKRDPRHGLCFNCGKPGHIAKVCQGLHAQSVQNVNATMIPRLAPEDLQFLVESLRVTVTLSAPTMPPAELEGEKNSGDKGF